MLRAGQGLGLIAVALLAIGVIMVNSTGLVVVDQSGAVTRLTAVDVLTGRTACLAAAAVALLVLGSRLPIGAIVRGRGLLNPAPWIILVSIALLAAVQLPGLGRAVHASRRWIEIGPLSFQASEVVKWGLPVALAAWCTRRSRRSDDDGFVGAFLLPMSLVAVLCALIAVEDLGTAVLVGAVSLIMVLAGGAKLRHAVMLVPIGLAGFVGALMQSPYRIDRLRAFVDPYADPQGIGYHVIQSMAAVSGGGLAGRGLGNGLQKFGYLPEDTTDFIFAIICEELGLVGAIAVIGLFASFVLCGLAVVQRTRAPRERLLALGIVCTFALQAVINLLVVTGLAPTKGIALPLVSSGGTGWCLTALAVGILMSIDREAGAESQPAAAPGIDGPRMVLATAE